MHTFFNRRCTPLDADAGVVYLRSLQEKLAVRVRFEDCFATIAPAHNMVDGPRILNSQLSSHTPRQTGLLLTVNTTILGTDPFVRN